MAQGPSQSSGNRKAGMWRGDLKARGVNDGVRTLGEQVLQRIASLPQRMFMTHIKRTNLSLSRKRMSGINPFKV